MSDDYEKNEEIRPCVFCESAHVEAVNEIDELSDYFFIRCRSCGATGPEGGTKAAAISRWNTPKKRLDRDRKYLNEASSSLIEITNKRRKA